MTLCPLFEPPPPVAAYVTAAVAATLPPASLLERNRAQMALVTAVRRAYPSVNEIDALVTVGVIYGARYPAPATYGVVPANPRRAR